MRKIVSSMTALFAFIFISTGVFAQITITVATPNGTSVQAEAYTPEMTQAAMNEIISYENTTYPNATRISNPSTTYNCHGYAWHIAEGGYPNVWMNVEDAYWTDKSYVEVCPELGTKASYVSGDHSAVKVYESDQLQSKWGSWSLMMHDWNYVPSIYNFSDMKYYMRAPKITGPDVLCKNGNFSVDYFPGGTISWTSSSNLKLITDQGQTTAQFEPLSTGAGWIDVSMTLPCGSTIVLKRKAVNVTSFTSLYINGPNLSTNGEFKYSVSNLPAGQTLTWNVTGGFYKGSSAGNSVTIFSNGQCSSGVVSATLSGTSCHKVVSVNISVAYNYPPNLTVVGNSSVPHNLWYWSYYLNEAIPGATSYRWEADYSTNVRQDGTRYATFQFLSTGYHYICPISVTPCGENYLDSHCISVYVYDGYSYAFSPNPARNELTVSYIEKQETKDLSTAVKTRKGNVFEAKLFDEKGKVVRHAKNIADPKNITFQTHDLPNGIYVLHITDEKETIKNQIVIEH